MQRFPYFYGAPFRLRPPVSRALGAEPGAWGGAGRLVPVCPPAGVIHRFGAALVSSANGWNAKFMSNLHRLPPLIRAADVARLGQEPRTLAKRSDKGELVRVRRGIYVSGEEWKQLDARTRYGLWAESLQHLTERQPVFCHATAALIWGLWIIGVPRKMHIITEATAGGRSRNTIVRHRGSLSTELVRCGPVLVTDKLTTTMRLITSLPFSEAVAVCDSSLCMVRERNQVNFFTSAAANTAHSQLDCSWSNDTPQGKPLLHSELAAAAELLPTQAAYRRAMAVINFSSGLSGSAGESLSRAHMYELGFPTPVLQHRFALRDGSNAFVDFWFKEQRTVGEFDGMGKYLRSDWGGGLTLAQRLLAEKKREDQIRAQGVKFVRWTWEEMRNRTSFESLLRAAGLPQERSAPPRAPRSA